MSQHKYSINKHNDRLLAKTFPRNLFYQECNYFQKEIKGKEKMFDTEVIGNENKITRACNLYK